MTLEMMKEFADAIVTTRKEHPCDSYMHEGGLIKKGMRALFVSGRYYCEVCLRNSGVPNNIIEETKKC